MALSMAGKPRIFLAHQNQNPSTAIYCNRPTDGSTTIPLSLLHPVFGQFMDDFCNAVPTYDEQLLALKLVNVMTPIYDEERARQYAIRNVFKSSGINLRRTKIDDHVSDGDVSFQGMRYLIAELRDELGSGFGSEPYLQGCVYYLESTRSDAMKHTFSPLPCLLMLIFGTLALFLFSTDVHMLFQVLTLLSQARSGRIVPTSRC